MITSIPVYFIDMLMLRTTCGPRCCTHSQPHPEGIPGLTCTMVKFCQDPENSIKTWRIPKITTNMIHYNTYILFATLLQMFKLSWLQHVQLVSSPTKEKVKYTEKCGHARTADPGDPCAPDILCILLLILRPMIQPQLQRNVWLIRLVHKKICAPPTAEVL